MGLHAFGMHETRGVRGLAPPEMLDSEGATCHNLRVLMHAYTHNFEYTCSAVDHISEHPSKIKLKLK